MSLKDLGRDRSINHLTLNIIKYQLYTLKAEVGLVSLVSDFFQQVAPVKIDLWNKVLTGILDAIGNWLSEGEFSHFNIR